MLKLDYKGNSLDILFNDKIVRTIRIGDCFMEIGEGSNTYSMSHGSFTIKEKILSKKSLTVSGIAFDGNVAEIKALANMQGIEVVEY